MTTQQASIDFIKTQNASYDVVIYSKSYCPYCSKTKQLFQKYYMPGSTVQVHELDKLSNGSSIQTALLTMTGQKTVPGVFVKGAHVGGNDDVHRMHQTGELKALLQNESSALHEDPPSFVAHEIQRHQVVIWSKSYCPYCQATKTFFRNKTNIDVKVHELDTMLDGVEIQKELLRLTGQRTVPNVFVNGEHLGGNDDTMQAAESGVLDQQLLVRSN